MTATTVIAGTRKPGDCIEVEAESNAGRDQPRLSLAEHAGRGDIVVFTRPASAEVPMADKELIKRVVSLPAETHSGNDGQI